MTASDRVRELIKDPALWDRSNADVLDAFVARTAHDSRATAHTYRRRVASQLRRYARQHGVPEPALRAVLTDADLFGRALAADRSLRVRAGDFPPALRLGGPGSRAVGWRRSGIEARLRDRPAA